MQLNSLVNIALETILKAVHLPLLFLWNYWNNNCMVHIIITTMASSSKKKSKSQFWAHSLTRNGAQSSQNAIQTASLMVVTHSEGEKKKLTIELLCFFVCLHVSACATQCAKAEQKTNIATSLNELGKHIMNILTLGEKQILIRHTASRHAEAVTLLAEKVTYRLRHWGDMVSTHLLTS